MAQIERQQTVLNILRNLRDLGGIKKLFWEELNYERENKPLSMRGWPDSTRSALADDPILFASGGEDHAFHVLYCRLASAGLQRNLERPVVNQLIREHPYCLFVFSDTTQSAWHFLNIKYDEKAEKRRLFRRITVQAKGGLRTAAERLQMIDLAAMGKDLSAIPALEIQKRHDDAFDVESVTKAFYRELANWYFWALKHVRFPKDAPKEADGHDHIGVIRMITRLIFCWFVKEKGLIPEVLFDQRRLDELLDGFAPDKDAREDSIFYKAILQNLFFATLNTEMDKRGWVKDEQNFMAHSLYRHRDLFKKPGDALALFKNIPFLNGGLFECLDKDLGESVKPRYVRIDGFSRRPDSQPVVPDFLFFGPEREEDLSADYGDRKFRKVRVRGLIHILHRYHFTIEENTPIEQEVALDPELSGKVFENLLAAYNPETGATARKQTGSFYTPREIVDYMVDEALIAFLKGSLTTENTEDTEKKLRRLMSWEESGHDFEARETEALIAAIDGLKALDPAVGSGAFPMGILHKLVFILGKLDPRNEQWEQRQIQRVRDAFATAEKIEDAAIREQTVNELEQQIASIEEAFERNELDYGRKLYLIENCLYGVDIQSIAVQIAKMRFFISLIVDQSVDPDATNLGVRPLPNLETKFVAANTLIGIEKPRQMLFRNPLIDAKETELRRVREKHFIARTLSSKAKCREQDKKLRGEIAELLKSDGWGDKTAKQLSQWDPYDQNASAPFFDPEWMFGISHGFNICMGNPPWVSLIGKHGIEENRNARAAYIAIYPCNTYMPNLYEYFIQRGLALLRDAGLLAYILPDRFAFNESFAKLRRNMLQQNSILQLVYKWKFESVIADTMTILVQRGLTGASELLIKNRPGEDFLAVPKQQIFSTEDCVFKAFKDLATKKLIEKIQGVSKPLRLFAKSTSGFGGKSGLITSERNNKRQIPVFKGASIQRYTTLRNFFFDFRPENLSGRTRDSQKLGLKEKVLLRKTGARLIATFDDSGTFPEQSLYFLYDVTPSVQPKCLLGLLNSNLLTWYYLNYLVTNLDSTPQLKNCDLDSMPIVVPSEQYPILSLATRILAAKAADTAADTSALEGEIDRMVYELYGLSDEEIRIVEEGIAR